MRFSVDVDVAVPMRDGIALATNVWLPEGPGPFPVLLIRTPYAKDDAGTYGNPKLPDVFAFVEAGYAVVAQDVRGTSRSPGTFVPGTHEGRDGADTLTWLAGQPWCDGTVGMWGGSYMGFTQWLAAAHADEESSMFYEIRTEHARTGLGAELALYAAVRPPLQDTGGGQLSADRPGC